MTFGLGGYTYGSVSGAESIQLRLGRGLEHFLGDVASSNQTLHDLNGNVPELLVLLLQQKDNTGGLGVEGARDVENGILHNALNDIVGDGALGLEAIVGTARLDQLQESGSSRVLEFGLSGAHCEGFKRNWEMGNEKWSEVMEDDTKQKE